ncbi:hypothetical protein MVEN_01986900 [Mycena venus]|uniref:Uncharacterized protein n=1 Tax=Mycena venus TaxID=2733690 RepID=A0A8H7CK99_9AGAR|nr:hypothetical protein MVEN_01986900 [Mycena venus]
MFPSVICLLGSPGLWSNHNLLPSEYWKSVHTALLSLRLQPALGLVSLPWPLSVYPPTLTSFKLTALPLLLSLVLGLRQRGKPVLGTSLSKTIVTILYIAVNTCRYFLAT